MKNFLLIVSLAGCLSANAQFDVYNHNFDTDESTGWSLVDYDNSGVTWTIENNEYNSLMGDGAVLDVLHLANGEMSTPVKSNWAILPVQDMSFYNGVKLHFSYLKGMFACEANDVLKIYAGTTSNVADMLENGPIATVTLEGDNSIMPPVAVEKTVDIPAAWNIAGVYFAIVHGRDTNDAPVFNWNVELTNVSLTAQELASVNGLNKTATIIKQNPVAEKLDFQLGTGVNPEALTVNIYNINGVLVKTAAYNDAGIAVNELTSGMYFAVLANDASKEQLKFIKK